MEKYTAPKLSPVALETVNVLMASTATGQDGEDIDLGG